MSILAAAAKMQLHMPAIRMPKWPRFKLGQHVSSSAEAYTQATSIAYTVALGLTPKPRVSKDYDY